MPLPGAIVGPSPLLLPGDGLLLGALRWLALWLGSLCLLLLWPLLLSRLGALLLRLLSGSLLGALLLRLLSGSLLGLLRPLLLNLRGGPLLLWLLLGPLLLWLLLGALRLCLLRGRRLAWPFLLAALRVGRVNRPEKHEQGSRADNANKLHRNRPPLISLARYARGRPTRLNPIALPRPGTRLPDLLISFEVFGRHVVLPDLCRVNFGHVRVGRSLHAADRFGFVGLPLLEQFFDTQWTCLGAVR
jgi:hypothetical protein